MKIFHAGSNVRTFACSLACCLHKAYTRKARLAVVRCSTIVLDLATSMNLVVNGYLPGAER
jgi:hypothetical protein